MYPNIDIEKTGLKIKAMLSAAGYDVKFIQQYLHLSCPQSIYKWFHGKSLPSVENLYALSLLLEVHMEDFLVKRDKHPVSDKTTGIWRKIADARFKRLLNYFDEIYKVA